MKLILAIIVLCVLLAFTCGQATATHRYDIAIITGCCSMALLLSLILAATDR